MKFERQLSAIPQTRMNADFRVSPARMHSTSMAPGDARLKAQDPMDVLSQLVSTSRPKLSN